MKETLEGFFYVYLMISAIALLCGLMDAGLHFSKPCLKQTRGSILVPAYKLGCYLGEPLE